MSRFKLRTKPRRIIIAFPFNHEFDILEARVHDLAEVADVFIIQESNFTNSGKSKPLTLKDRLENSWLWEFHKKIVYLSRTSEPAGGFRFGQSSLCNPLVGFNPFVCPVTESLLMLICDDTWARRD